MEAEQCGSEPHARGLSYSPRCISDGRYVCCVPHFGHAAVLLSAGGNGLFLRPALHRAGLPPLCRFCNTQKRSGLPRLVPDVIRRLLRFRFAAGVAPFVLTGCRFMAFVWFVAMVSRRALTSLLGHL